MAEAFICDYVRTPIGRFGGALAAVRPDDLGAIPLRALAERNGAVDWVAVAKGSSIGGVPIATPVIILAVAGDRQQSLGWLLRHKPDLETRCNMLDATAVYYAAQRGHDECLRQLLQAGAQAEVSTLGHSPESALDAAKRFGHAGCAALLETAMKPKDVVVAVPRWIFK